ncbi:unnamed protein product [Trichogramma brassicae]|uniref:Uncharacterized protein n=1 Tax=Trichogramma brassicae TaxID=86971 RepID=A0A6H5I2F1_9HYME|nr:unnamed protein product [Trichogramma brassicae]
MPLDYGSDLPARLRSAPTLSALRNLFHHYLNSRTSYSDTGFLTAFEANDIARVFFLSGTRFHRGHRLDHTRRKNEPRKFRLVGIEPRPRRGTPCISRQELYTHLSQGGRYTASHYHYNPATASLLRQRGTASDITSPSATHTEHASPTCSNGPIIATPLASYISEAPGQASEVVSSASGQELVLSSLRIRIDELLEIFRPREVIQ